MFPANGGTDVLPLMLLPNPRMKQRHQLRRTIEAIYASQGLKGVFVSVKPLPLDLDKNSVMRTAEAYNKASLSVSPVLLEWPKMRERRLAAERQEAKLHEDKASWKSAFKSLFSEERQGEDSMAC